MKTFNHEQAFKEKIQPLLDQLSAACAEIGVNGFTAFDIICDEEGRMAIAGSQLVAPETETLSNAISVCVGAVSDNDFANVAVQIMGQIAAAKARGAVEADGEVKIEIAAG